jgi:hypothetical protein
MKKNTVFSGQHATGVFGANNQKPTPWNPGKPIHTNDFGLKCCIVEQELKNEITGRNQRVGSHNLSYQAPQ